MAQDGHRLPPAYTRKQILMAQSTVIITGGTGYIGSHVTKELRRSGYRTAVIDLVPRAHARVYADEFFMGSYDSDSALEFIRAQRPVCLIHCAGTSLVGPSVMDPAPYYVNNVLGTIRLLEGLRTLEQVPSVVFSSSAAVYGCPDRDIITEDTALEPVSPYGRSKLMIEEILEDYSRAYGVRSLSLRYFNACGADVIDGDLGQEPGATHILARLLESLRNRESFCLNGTDYATKDGTCVRDYVHVSDLARAHVMAMDYLAGGGASGAVNLGSGQGHSNQDIITAVRQHLGDVNVVVGPGRPGDPDRLVASNLKAQEILGWRPKYSDLATMVTSAGRWYNLPG
jgi:UDP-glucose-4-epimerase GalE